VGADVEVRHRRRTRAATLSILQETLSGEKRDLKRQREAPVVAFGQRLVQILYPFEANRHFRINDRVDGQQATAGGSETARQALGRRFVRVDGWATEEWLARGVRARGDDGPVIASAARGVVVPAVDPTLSAANLLALRTQLAARGARDR